MEGIAVNFLFVPAMISHWSLASTSMPFEPPMHFEHPPNSSSGDLEVVDDDAADAVDAAARSILRWEAG